MKCFTYTLNANGESPSGRLPIGSITGYMANNVYYAAALIDNLSNLSDWNAKEITPLQFNQAFPYNTNTAPALSSMESEIRKYYAEKISAVAAPYTAEERNTWNIQVKEAQDYTSNNAASTPLLTAIATARGVTVENLVSKIITKDAAWKTSVGAVIGEQQALIDTIWKTS